MRLARLVVALIGLGLAVDATAGSFTVTTTPEQDAALAQELDRLNAERAGRKGLPPLTADQAMQLLVDIKLRAAVDRMKAEEDAALARRYRQADKATQDAVKATLGLAP